MNRDDEPILVSRETAVRLLEEAAHDDGDRRIVHTFVVAGRVDCGADWELNNAVEYVRNADPVGFAAHPYRHELAAARDGRVVYFDVQCPDGFVTDVSDDDVRAAAEADHAEIAERRRHYVEHTVPSVIAEHGWTVQGVFPTTEDNQTPMFHYTIGLTAKGRAELILLGLPPEMAAPILNLAAKRHIANPIQPGTEVDVDYSVKFRAIGCTPDVVTEYACIAGEIYGAENVTVIQLMWPDNGGNYPTDPGWKPGCVQFPLTVPAEVN